MSYRYTTTAWAIAADRSLARSRRRRARARRRLLASTILGAAVVLAGIGLVIGLTIA